LTLSEQNVEKVVRDRGLVGNENSVLNHKTPERMVKQSAYRH